MFMLLFKLHGHVEDLSLDHTDTHARAAPLTRPSVQGKVHLVAAHSGSGRLEVDLNRVASWRQELQVQRQWHARQRVVLLDTPSR